MAGPLPIGVWTNLAFLAPLLLILLLLGLAALIARPRGR